MAAEPIVIFSNKIDPPGVLKLLRGLAPDLQVQGPDDNWTRITISGPKKLLRKPAILNFGHDRNYYAGSGWQKQMSGMQGYFSRFPTNENTARIMLLIQSFQFSLTTFPAPEPELYIDSDDARLAYIFAVVKHLDGVIFLPSSLRDASGRVLYGVGDPDPQARMPAIFKHVEAKPRAERNRSEHGTLPDDDDPPPPTPQRAARRACALAAVTARALLEQEDRANPSVEHTRQRILQWIEDIGIHDELEPDEWEFIQLPLGVPPQQDIVNATWRLEGLGILAWALTRLDATPHDQLVNPGVLLPSVCILNGAKAAELLANPILRPDDELKRMRERLFAVNWRLTDFRVRSRAIDFKEFARTAWFGPLDLTEVPLIESDLAIGDAPLSRATPAAVGTATSAATERHLAINWLNGGSEIYSRTDVST